MRYTISSATIIAVRIISQLDHPEGLISENCMTTIEERGAGVLRVWIRRGGVQAGLERGYELV